VIEVVCPLCGEVIKGENWKEAFAITSLHLFGHTEKKNDNKTEALEDAIRMANILVAISEGQLIENENTEKIIDEFIDKYGGRT